MVKHALMSEKKVILMRVFEYSVALRYFTDKMAIDYNQLRKHLCPDRLPPFFQLLMQCAVCSASLYKLGCQINPLKKFSSVLSSHSLHGGHVKLLSDKVN